MKNDRFAILIYRKSGNAKQYLLVRAIGETLLHFPIVTRESKESNKDAIKRGLRTSFHLEAGNFKRLAITHYQAPGVGFFPIFVYSADLTINPYITGENEALIWMDKVEIHEHSAQMSNLMQESIIPSLDEDDAWL